MKQRDGTCYNSGKKSHFTRDCKYKRRRVEGNDATSRSYQQNSEERDAQASIAVVEEASIREEEVSGMALTSVVVETEPALQQFM